MKHGTYSEMIIKNAARFIETGCRRARKYEGAFITGTQSINDYYKNAAALAAFENSDWICLLAQKRESIDQLKLSNRLSMGGHMERLLKDIHKKDEYAEVMIYGPQGYAVVRLFLDPFSKILYSSKGDDFVSVKKLIDEGVSLEEAIQIVAKEMA